MATLPGSSSKKYKFGERTCAVEEQTWEWNGMGLNPINDSRVGQGLKLRAFQIGLETEEGVFLSNDDKYKTWGQGCRSACQERL